VHRRSKARIAASHSVPDVSLVVTISTPPGLRRDPSRSVAPPVDPIRTSAAEA
jgi:hypothetical protein